MSHFPSPLHNLPRFEGPFEALRLAAKDCEVLFASYPADTTIAAHSHETENVGVITKGELLLTIDGKETRSGHRNVISRPSRDNACRAL